MATLELSEPIFAETIENTNSSFLTFGQSGVAPARLTAPYTSVCPKLSPTSCLEKINTEEQQGLAGMFGIRSIPTTIAFKEGIGVFMQPGALPEDALTDLIGKLKEIDMDEVRAELAAQKAESGEDADGE